MLPRGFPNDSAALTPVPFATTRWSQVLAARDGASPQGAAALEELCRAYWYPLYAFLRRGGHSPQDAQDLTQAFFAQLVEKDVLKHVARERGRFRSFLLASVKHFAAKERRKAHTLKRGGAFRFVSVDEETFEMRYGGELPHALSPENLFDRSWSVTLIETVLERMRKEYRAAGKEKLFEVLQPCLAGEMGRAPCTDLAAGLGMTVGAMKMAVLRARRRFGELLRAEIAQTVSSPEEIDGEIRHLCSVLEK